MEKLIILILILQTILLAKSFTLKNIYVGFDTSVTVNGEETFGSTSNGSPPEKYSVKSAILFKLGYKINDLVRIELGHNKFKKEQDAQNFL
jgi:hypothetical protein